MTIEIQRTILNRLPMILQREVENTWFDPDAGDEAPLTTLNPLVVA